MSENSEIQIYDSQRYIAPRLTILPLPSGRFAVGRGYNPPNLIKICENEQELVSLILDRAKEARLLHETQQSRLSKVEIIDLDFQSLFDNLEINI